MTTIARYPFDGPKADVVLRSSDNVDFFTHKVILGLASSSFDKNYLSQTDDKPALSDSAAKDIVVVSDGVCLPVVQLQEDSHILDLLLRLFYPTPGTETFTELSTLANVLEAALKYVFDKAISLLKTSLASFVNGSPLKVYAIACRLGLEDEAKHAAQVWKNQVNTTSTTPCQGWESHHLNGSVVAPCSAQDCKQRPFEQTILGSTYTAEMEHITAGCLYRLLMYVQDGKETRFCGPEVAAEDKHVTPEELPEPAGPAEVEAGSDFTSDFGDVVSLPDSPPSITDVPGYYPADLILRSSDGKLIHTYQILLHLSSAHSILAKAHESPCQFHEGVRVVYLEEDEATIRGLLELCQPPKFKAGPARGVWSVPLDLIPNVWKAAKKYGMEDAMNIARTSCLQYTDVSPVGVYIVAITCQWDDGARAAAHHLAESVHAGSDLLGYYVPEMETISALPLYRLYKFLHEYRKAVLDTCLIYSQTSSAAISGRSIIPGEDFLGMPASVPVVAGPVSLQDYTRLRKDLDLCSHGCCTRDTCNGYNGSYCDNCGVYRNGYKLNVSLRSLDDLVADSCTFSRQIKDAVSKVSSTSFRYSRVRKTERCFTGAHSR